MSPRQRTSALIATVAVLALGFASPSHAAVIYANGLATGSNSGTSWSNAFTSLSAALAAASTGDEVWVAKGTYKPGATRASTFTLASGVAVYGGFVGTESTRAARNWQTNKVILSGDINGDDTGFTNNSENCYHVVTGALNAIIDGCYISGANNNQPGFADDGGGLRVPTGATGMQVTNCMFSYNTAWDGGGSYPYEQTTFKGCVFAHNHAVDTGGGASGVGGGLQSAASDTVDGCIFYSNTADTGGGGLNSYSAPAITNCVFAGNSAPSGGGVAITFTVSTALVTLTHCTLANNTASTGGGFTATDRPISLNYCILFGNTASVSGGQGAVISTSGSETEGTNNCIVQGGAAGIATSGTVTRTDTAISASNPLLISASSPAGTDGTWFTSDDGLNLQSTSPAIDAAVGSVLTVDIAGTVRPQGANPDIGAYEFVAGGGTSTGGTATAGSTSSGSTAGGTTGGATPSSSGGGGCGLGSGLAAVLVLGMALSSVLLRLSRCERR